MTKTHKDRVPKYNELMWPTLKVLKGLGGSATNAEILSKVIEAESIPEDVQEIQQENTNQSKLEHRLSWARTYLKLGGAVNNSQRGVWSLTDMGENLSEADVIKLWKELLERRNSPKTRTKKFEKENATDPEIQSEHLGEPDVELDWKDKLLDAIKVMAPDAFERLAQRILRESGFKSVEVTGKVGDGGIDGLGVLQVNLITFSIGFQCKRYTGSVGSPEIRNFRGSLDGRCEKGLFITTGNFTADARKEANRDGARTIDLVDGERLCDLLKELELGVSTQLVEEVQIDEGWFAHI